MGQFFDFLLSLGGLHDATVVSIDWQIETNTIEFTFDDLYANFRGLPEYPGRHRGSIQLQGVSQVDFNVDSSEPLKVFEMLPAEGRIDEVVAKFSPSGTISVCFASAVYPKSALNT